MRPVRYLTLVLFVLGFCDTDVSAQSPKAPRLLTEFGIKLASIPPISSDGLITKEIAIARALRYSPHLKSLESDIQALGHAARQARAYPNPNVSAEIEDWGRQKENGPSQATLVLEQTIPLWGKRGRAFDAVDARRLAIEAAWQAEALDLYARTSSLYASLLGGQEKLIQAGKRLALSRETEQAVATKLREGAVPESEVQRAIASRSLAQVDSLIASSEIERARTELGALVGINLSGVNGVGNLSGASALAIPDTLSYLLGSHPLVVASESELDARRKEAQLARTQGKPDLTVSAGYRRLRDASDNGVLFGISLPLPIRNPNKAGIAESDARIDAAEASLRQVTLDLESEIRRMAVAWKQRSDEISLIETQTLPAIEQSLASLDLAYRVGQQPYINLLDVQRTQSELQTRLIDAMVEKAQLEARLEALLGQRIETTER